MQGGNQGLFLRTRFFCIVSVKIEVCKKVCDFFSFFQEECLEKLNAILLPNLNWRKGLAAWNTVFKFFDDEADLQKVIRTGYSPSAVHANEGIFKHLHVLHIPATKEVPEQLIKFSM
jgi:hypothetical protein